MTMTSVKGGDYNADTCIFVNEQTDSNIRVASDCSYRCGCCLHHYSFVDCMENDEIMMNSVKGFF